MELLRIVTLRNALGLSFAVLGACGSSDHAEPLLFETCSDSPTELLRLEGTAAGLSIDAFDLGQAISVRYALESESDPSNFRYPETFSVVDNWGESRCASPTAYVGARTVTGLGVPPESDDDRLWLFQRSADGELEVIADNLASGQDDFMGHPWTPELGRISCSVRDADGVSIRQHRLER